MKRSIISVSLLLLIINIFIFSPIFLLNSRSESLIHVSDLANVLDTQEEASLEEQAGEVLLLTGFDIILHTTNDSQSKGPMNYSSDYYHSFRDAATYPDGAMFSIIFDTGDYYEATRGRGIELLTHRQSDDLGNLVQEKLSSGDYYGAMKDYVNYVKDLLIIPNDVIVTSPALAESAALETQTVMVYIVGSDLESNHGAATRDITEMLKARANPEKIRVLVMTGGANKWQTPLIKNDGVSVYEIKGNRPQLVHSLPAQSMGDPQTLSDFLQYSVDNYPSDSYGLVLWDHGGGPMVGFGVDQRYKGDTLSLLELRQGMENSPFNRGQMLEWIGFDACLMSSVEVAHIAAKHANYMIASQETLPGEGWSYYFLENIANTSLQGPEVAQLIIEQTMAFYDKAEQNDSNRKYLLTLSCLDLRQLSSVETAIDSLFAQMDIALSQGSYPVFAQSRDAVKAFGRFNTADNFDLIDLKDLADQFYMLYPDECEELINAIKSIVIINDTNQDFSCGLSLYYPFNNKVNYQNAWKDDYPTFAFAPAYTAFMQHFGENLLSQSTVEWAGSKALQPLYNKQAGEYYLQLTPEQSESYLKGYFFIIGRMEGEHYSFLSMSSNVELDEDNRLTANFDGNVLMLRDNKKGVTTIPFVNEREAFKDVDRYQSKVILYPFDYGVEGNHEEVATLMFEVDKINKTAQIAGAFLNNENQALHGKIDINLQEWRLMAIAHSGYYETRDENGDLLPFHKWESSGWITGHELFIGPELEVLYDDILATGRELYCLITMEDVYGNQYTSEKMPIGEEQITPEQTASKGPAPLHALTWEPAVFTMDSGAMEKQVLFEREGVSVYALEVVETKERYANASVDLVLEVVNQNSFPISIQTNQLVINQSSVDDMYVKENISFGSFDFMGNTTTEARIQIDHESLIAARIREIKNIDFILEVRNTDTYDEIGLSGPISIRLTESLPRQPIPIQEQEENYSVLYEHEDIRLEIGKAYSKQGDLSIDYRLTNSNDMYNLFEINDITINDTMGFNNKYLSVRQNTHRDGTLSFYESELSKNRISVPDRMEFQLVYYRDGLTQAQRKEHGYFTERLTIELDVPKPSTDQVILDQNGVCITRVGDDPAGQTFRIENHRDQLLTIKPSERSAIGEDRYDLAFYVTDLLPGKQIYVRTVYDDKTPYLELPPVKVFYNIINSENSTLLFTTEELILNR